MYKDEKLMRICYSGWESWLVKEGKEMMVESVMAMWTEDNEAKKKGVEKGNYNESKIGLSESENEDEEGYSSEMDLRKMPSRRWSKDAWRKSDKGYSTPDDKRGRESEEEEHSDERDRAEKRRKLGKKGNDSIGGVEVNPAKTQGQVHEGRRKSRIV